MDQPRPAFTPPLPVAPGAAPWRPGASRVARNAPGAPALNSRVAIVSCGAPLRPPAGPPTLPPDDYDLYTSGRLDAGAPDLSARRAVDRTFDDREHVPIGAFLGDEYDLYTLKEGELDALHVKSTPADSGAAEKDALAGAVDIGDPLDTRAAPLRAASPDGEAEPAVEDLGDVGAGRRAEILLSAKGAAISGSFRIDPQALARALAKSRGAEGSSTAQDAPIFGTFRIETAGAAGEVTDASASGDAQKSASDTDAAFSGSFRIEPKSALDSTVASSRATSEKTASDDELPFSGTFSVLSGAVAPESTSAAPSIEAPEKPSSKEVESFDSSLVGKGDATRDPTDATSNDAAEKFAADSDNTTAASSRAAPETVAQDEKVASSSGAQGRIDGKDAAFPESFGVESEIPEQGVTTSFPGGKGDENVNTKDSTSVVSETSRTEPEAVARDPPSTPPSDDAEESAEGETAVVSAASGIQLEIATKGLAVSPASDEAENTGKKDAVISVSARVTTEAVVQTPADTGVTDGSEEKTDSKNDEVSALSHGESEDCAEEATDAPLDNEAEEAVDGSKIEISDKSSAKAGASAEASPREEDVEKIENADLSAPAVSAVESESLDEVSTNISSGERSEENVSEKVPASPVSAASHTDSEDVEEDPASTSLRDETEEAASGKDVAASVGSGMKLDVVTEGLSAAPEGDQLEGLSGKDTTKSETSRITAQSSAESSVEASDALPGGEVEEGVDDSSTATSETSLTDTDAEVSETLFVKSESTVFDVAEVPPIRDLQQKSNKDSGKLLVFGNGSFSSLGLSEEISTALKQGGIVTPTRVQQRTIPPILGGADVIVGAATGSGKTFAYLLPVIASLKSAEQLNPDVSQPLRVVRRPRALVIVPTRELSEQALAVAKNLSHQVKFRVIGTSSGLGTAGFKKLKTQLDSSPVDILVSTTGRLLQLMEAQTVDLRFVKHLVVDEVDTMFDEGFGPELKRILRACRGNDKGTNKPQCIAVGATHPRAAELMYAEEFPKAKRIDVDLHVPPPGLEARFIRTTAEGKLQELVALLGNSRKDGDLKGGRLIIFCNTVSSARFVDHFLSESGFTTSCVHGDIPPDRRASEFQAFKSGEVQILVCTDVAARGLDNLQIAHVVIFDFPTSAVDYIHRAGRTARAGSKGRVTSLVLKRDLSLARAIERSGKEKHDALVSARIAREEETARKALDEANRREMQRAAEDGEVLPERRLANASGARGGRGPQSRGEFRGSSETSRGGGGDTSFGSSRGRRRSGLGFGGSVSRGRGGGGGRGGGRGRGTGRSSRSAGNGVGESRGSGSGFFTGGRGGRSTRGR